MRPRHPLLGLGVGTAALIVVAATASEAQLVPKPPITEMEWKVRTVRASGQPVLPIFEGWYPAPDGSYRLCFGFFNLNREEALDLPLGPDNFIEPARFDGAQPTHFPALGPRVEGRPIAREHCVFTVSVPADIGSERVWWNLRVDGHVYRVPGHITSRPYLLDDLVNSVGVAMERFDENEGYSGTRVAPVVRFETPSGDVEGRGKSGFRAGPVTARAAVPLALRLSVSLPAEAASTTQRLKWTEFRGPPGARVSFDARESVLDAGPAPIEHVTEATFSHPGEYVLLLQVLNGSYADQCCWTNAQVAVTVTD